MQVQLIYLLYRVLQVLGFPLIVVYFLVRGIKDKRYFRRFSERLGRLPGSFRQTGQGAVWLHAVSVGEVLAALELLRRIRIEFPTAPLFVSTTTLAGRALADQKLAGIADGVFYAPLDFRFAVRGVLRCLRPRAVIIMETEIWPNVFREAKRAGCGLLVVNARISDRALPRYRRMKWFFGAVLPLADAILAQNEISRERFVALGAPELKVRVAGNLKYDFDPGRTKAPQAVLGLLERVKPEAVWVAASTMPPAQEGDPDEDDVIIDVFQQLRATHPRLLLILVPRKPERFDDAAAKLEWAGIPLLRRSKLEGGDTLPLPGVLLLDTIGELAGVFSLADIVFMGGTLPHRGGHNILEPAFFGKPVIVGPHMENFPDIAEKFLAAGAVVRVEGAAGLAPAVARLLDDRASRIALGASARRAAESEQGATVRVISEIRTAYSRALFRYRPALPYRALLWPLSRMWLAGSHVKQARDLRRRAKLRTPVISVGGVTAGGTGKSPLVLWLAERLDRPAILTRGYRRREKAMVILERGAKAPVDATGDEAQAYLRAAAGPVGITADRAGAGREIEGRFQPGVFLLDDGFQHWRLARDVDIVAIDALDPFGGEQPLPLGRLRVPLRALAKADIIVVTRVAPGDSVEEIERVIRRYNPNVPVFASRVLPEAWVDAESGQEYAPGEFVDSKMAAFCGLGNPASFWRTLADLGINPVHRRAFPDHHKYSLEDLVAQASACARLLTTEKDFHNLPGGWPEAIRPARLYWLKTSLEIDGGEEFVRAVKDRLARPGSSARGNI